ncbi:aminoacyl-tRNA hydrolase [Pueribacillus theae]|uniref:Peptidyl-tRNA hydrolase n=1 Tax=Pueribacillus theae TaxID=2171751 RepID=A0A2U1K3N2_9BACI|nr:aminoacyl-tRNA hydrolase [Pueribacillus theae]PWA12126.1 aminoacyl-tRNA hydrolase [Pueribacillus theae]
MKLIVGLGNPGKKYEQTRHNVGFMAIDHLSKKLSLEFDKNKFQAVYGTKMIDGEKIMLCKPLTYMNLSGEAVRPLLDYYGMELEDLLVIYDDLDLAPGKLRLRQKGSAGGHNGIKSIIKHVGTEQFKRIRIGIGRPDPRMDVIDYVLARFSKDEQPLIDEAIARTAQACEKWARSPFSQVMNEFNG